jgi:hypothetical protein
MTKNEAAYFPGLINANERQTNLQAAIAELHRPLPKYRDPLTKCRDLTANFRHREKAGELYVPAVGDVIWMPRTDAPSNVALGRVEILK